MAGTSDFSSYIDANEKVLWMGAPRRGLMLRSEDLFLLPFGIFFLLFSLFWEASALGLMTAARHEAPPFFGLFGLPFIFMGAYLAFGRFIWDADVRGRTSYALTTRRALILSRWPGTKLRSMGITTATEITTVERANGSGTIYFGPRNYGPWGWGRNPWRASPDGFLFEGIKNVREAMRVVRSLQGRQ